jgi:uroporphyrinogen-III synthase
MSGSPRLQGVGVVITRPRHAAEALAAPLAREGARVIVFPALAIEEMPATAQLKALLADLTRFDLAIFVSANAVEKGLAAVERYGRFPAGIRIAAIGEATAAALRNSGFEQVISPPERHDSEALLGLAQLQVVKGQNIIVFRGEGGREQLKEVLESRGASVQYAECYRRVRPASDPRPVADALARGEVQAVSVLSAETLENFLDMIGAEARARLASAALVVPHAAIASSAAAKKFGRIVVAGHGPEALIDALTQIRVTTHG